MKRLTLIAVLLLVGCDTSYLADRNIKADYPGAEISICPNSEDVLFRTDNGSVYYYDTGTRQAIKMFEGYGIKTLELNQAESSVNEI